MASTVSFSGLNARKRIACVFEHPTMSGGERSMLEVLRLLSDREEYEFLALVPAQGPLRNALERLGVRTLPFERVRQPEGSHAPAELSARALGRVLDADLVHGNSLSTAQFTGLAGESLGIPSVSHVREIERLSGARVCRIEKNRKVIAVSEAVRRHLVGQGLPPEKIEVVYNGVDVGALQPECVPGSIRAELAIPEHAPLIAAVGQISLRKATDVFIQCVLRLAFRLSDLHALVVGKRFSQHPENLDLEVAARRTVRAEGLEDRVHFLGWRNDVPSILRDLDLLVHAARQEPLGRVLLEASALGVPCVATAVGGTPEIIDDGLGGWLVPPDDPDLLAGRVLWALENPLARRRAGLEARKKAETTFPAEACARRVESIWRELLSG